MTWTEAVALVDLSRFPFHVALRLLDADGPNPALVVSMWVPERDGGTRENGFFGLDIPFQLPQVVSFAPIRAAILSALEHELDEMFIVRGQGRVFDPHRGEKKR